MKTKKRRTQRPRRVTPTPTIRVVRACALFLFARFAIVYPDRPTGENVFVSRFASRKPLDNKDTNTYVHTRMRVVNNINARLCKHGGCTVSVRTRRTRRVTRTRRNIGFRADFVFVLFARCVLPYYRGAKSALGVFVNVFCFFIAFFSAGDGERGSNWDVGTFISPETPVRPSAAGGGKRVRCLRRISTTDGRRTGGGRRTGWGSRAAPNDA